MGQRQLADGTKIRLLTIVDIFRRESVVLEVDFGFKAPQVVDVLHRVAAERGKPQRVRCDNGPEFISLQTSGLIGTACSSTSRGPEGRQITLSANRFDV